MNFQQVIFSLFMLFLTIFPLEKGIAQEEYTEEHTKVCMRMIGHKILLQNGDSTSRILPIEKDVFRYRIRFESEFDFYPDELAATVNHAMDSCQMASRYIVEVVECETNFVVYSYQKGHPNQPDMIPCKGRKQPTGCYYLHISILDYVTSNQQPLVSEQDPIDPPQKSKRSNVWSWLIGGILVVAIILFLIKTSSKKNSPISTPHLIQLGDYQFDQRNMSLSHHGQLIELTSKESDLLTLLYTCVNDTIEREVILKKVWGDEGDYIGRTLDVFISKLRKKLEADANIKIVNIRGVGYKMILNDPV